MVSGLAGYVVTWRVFVEAGAAGYGVFSVFWSALFLVVGVLFGVQQEATRAVAQTDPPALGDRPRASLATFAAALAVVVVAVVLATSPLWAPSGLGAANAGLAWFVAVGAGFNCLVAAASGIMAGAGLWRQLAAIIAVDGVLRVVFVLAALAFGGPLWLIALAVVLPFPLSLLIVVASAPRRILGRVTVGESFASLTANTGRTMLAASATAVLINGFPLVLSFFATGSGAGHAGLGSLVLAVTLTRAPILVPLTALSSFLVSRFTHHPEQVARTLTAIMAGIAALAAVMCLCAYFLGLPVMKAVFGQQFDLAPGALAALVGSAALIGALSVSGAAVLARGRHGMYATGWVVASVITLALLFLPLPLAPRAALALAAGPAVGVAIHLFALRARRTAPVGAAVEATEGDAT